MHSVVSRPPGLALAWAAPSLLAPTHPCWRIQAQHGGEAPDAAGSPELQNNKAVPTHAPAVSAVVSMPPAWVPVEMNTPAGLPTSAPLAHRPPVESRKALTCRREEG